MFTILPMTKLTLKWAFKKPVTSRYPFEPRKPLAGSRGLLEFSADSCTYCTVCARKCPTNAIVVDRAKKTWTLDRLACISCACCVDICPKKSLHLEGMHPSPATARTTETFGAGTLPPSETPPAPATAAPATPAAKPAEDLAPAHV